MLENTILKTAIHNLDQSVSRLQLDESMRQRLCEPKEKLRLPPIPHLPAAESCIFVLS